MDLEFLPAGDALLTRRAKANSTRSAVVVRFSKTRRRYERQGLLVEHAALRRRVEMRRSANQHRRHLEACNQTRTKTLKISRCLMDIAETFAQCRCGTFGNEVLQP